ncbi:MAG: type VII secretion integral membrane protein EccD [Corynebacterium sp.]|uniref:type VII secretion integral membrane protein EccD n=1 Tax=Corynebacterium sp. TaxID=1720 RepID=UPI0026E027B1|nr:type VII secretion integral membrane protein EccD [Corynebacterium sp.]MDO5670787.1 type VII secretion integral membrane protein EccD [Corynebacterium sp.]
MSIDHVLRVTVRFQVGVYQRDADVALPAGSTLAEVIPEIVSLIGAPRISRPWLSTTAAGTPLDPAVPLHQTGLEDGAVIVCTPRHAGALPVLRDAAEALAETGSPTTAQGLAAAGTIAGSLAVLFIASAHLPWSQALALATGAVGAVVVANRQVRGLAVPVLWGAGAAAAATVLESARPAELTEPATLGLAALAACGTSAAALLLLVVLRGIGERASAAAATLLAAAGIAALGAFVPSHVADPGLAAAALVVAAGVVFIAQVPTLATRAAGLKVPRLPTAGQDLQVTDGTPADIGTRAHRARHFHAGAAIGAAGAMIPAVAVIGSHGGGFAQGLCVATAGAVVLHAARHRQAVAAWSWMSVGLAACIAAAVAAAHPAQWVLASALAAAALTAPLWAARVPELEPTAVVWWERAESLALAATLPLAAHLAGLFVLIRGLG